MSATTRTRIKIIPPRIRAHFKYNPFFQITHGEEAVSWYTFYKTWADVSCETVSIIHLSVLALTFSIFYFFLKQNSTTTKYPRYSLRFVYFLQKREEIWRSCMTNTLNRQTIHRWIYTKTLQKRSVTQRSRTDLGQSVGATTVIKSVWLATSTRLILVECMTLYHTNLLDDVHKV